MAIPALIATNSIPRFLEAIRKAAVPVKVDINYLKGLGFKNSNDSAIPPLFKSLGFLDAAGKPTEIFRSYRAASSDEARRILGTAVKTCYSGLFDVYPDAYRKDDEALSNWIRANTEKGEVTQGRALKTFKALIESAAFDQDPAAPAEDPDSAITPNDVSHSTPNGSRQGVAPIAVQYATARSAPEVSINITLQIAATNDASIYDKFFAAMKRHLFPDES